MVHYAHDNVTVFQQYLQPMIQTAPLSKNTKNPTMSIIYIGFYSRMLMLIFSQFAHNYPAKSFSVGTFRYMAAANTLSYAKL
jgi:hypothetical protein